MFRIRQSGMKERQRFAVEEKQTELTGSDQQIPRSQRQQRGDVAAGGAPRAQLPEGAAVEPKHPFAVRRENQLRTGVSAKHPGCHADDRRWGQIQAGTEKLGSRIE